MPQKKNIAILGCGNISEIYLENLSQSKLLHISGVCDIDAERARQAKERYQLAKVYEDLAEILADPKIELVVNLTTPPHHYRLNKEILQAGKSVYCEKPLAMSYAEAKELVALAKTKKLQLSAAPDTFLGDAFALIKRQIDEGCYGVPVTANLQMLCPGHESWHPDPEFYYKKGGGPLWDMGPYYLSAITYLFGSIAEVFAFGKKQRSQRQITSEPKNGLLMDVEIDTHIQAQLRFCSGFIASLQVSFDIVGAHEQPNMQLYFENGIVRAPDPNTFGAAVPFFLASDAETGWQKLSVAEFSLDTRNQRGRGIEELLFPPQKSLMNASRPLHVVEVMEKITRSCESGQLQTIESRLN